MSFYYAYLDEKDICISVSDLGVEVTDDYYIRIDTLDQSLIGKWYDRTDSTFKDAPVHILADHSSSIVNYKNQDVWLDDVIDGKANISDVYTKTAANGIFVKETDLLDEIKTVDGAGSGLDADTLDGKQASEFAMASHTHSAYAAVNHTHTDYAPVSHTHDYAASNHTHSQYAAASHTHTQYANSSHTHAISDVENLQSSLDAKANASHTHNYAAVNHTHDYAASEHTHAISEVTGLQSALDGKASSSHSHSAATTSSAGLMSAADKTKLDGIATGANKTTVDSALSSTSTNPVQNKVINSALAGKAASNHTHSGYASSDHTHSQYAASSHTHSGYAASNHTHSEYAASSHTHDYLPLSGGTLSGNLTINGTVFKVGGQQSIYVTDSRMTFGTTNRETYITGSTIYSRSAIQVASDERLKEGVKAVDVNKLAEFIRKLEIVDYNYIGEDKQRIGVIAQQVQNADPEIAKRFVGVREDGYLSVSFSELVFPLIAAVQELQKRVEELEKVSGN